jgi:hypothetical protein
LEQRLRRGDMNSEPQQTAKLRAQCHRRDVQGWIGQHPF